jgi:putative transposase
MKNSYSKIVRDLVKDLPKNDDPVLNTRLWVESLFHFIINQSLRSIRDLTNYLKGTETQFHLSTFARANQNRNTQVFVDSYQKISPRKFDKTFRQILALDSTTITRTSKLFHQRNYREAKLLCSHNSGTRIP